MVQGEIGDKMFILFKGKANILIKSETRQIVVATVQGNQVVGEKAILEQECLPRTATVQAVTEVHALILHKRHYDAILYQD